MRDRGSISAMVKDGPDIANAAHVLKVDGKRKPPQRRAADFFLVNRKAMRRFVDRGHDTLDLRSEGRAWARPSTLIPVTSRGEFVDCRVVKPNPHAAGFSYFRTATFSQLTSPS